MNDTRLCLADISLSTVNDVTDSFAIVDAFAVHRLLTIRRAADIAQTLVNERSSLVSSPAAGGALNGADRL